MPARRDRLRAAALPVAQSAAAAGLAWAAATLALGHERPFFAPIAAVIVLGAAAGVKLRRAVEMVFGVALGILVADALILALGTGTLQIALVVGLAMGAAVALGGGPLLVGQAGTSAVLVATLQPPTDDPSLSLERFVDCLLGGGIAIAVAALVPLDPLRLAARAAQPIFDDLAAVLHETGAALAGADVRRAEAALERARTVDERMSGFQDALAAAQETARVAPPRRRARRRLDPYAAAAGPLDLAVRNVRVLARGAIRSARTGRQAPPGLVASVADLRAAVEALATLLDDPGANADVRTPALRAAGRATLLLAEHGDLSTSAIVGQVRFTALDLLRAAGVDPDAALQAINEAPALVRAEEARQARDDLP